MVPSQLNKLLVKLTTYSSSKTSSTKPTSKTSPTSSSSDPFLPPWPSAPNPTQTVVTTETTTVYHPPPPPPIYVDQVNEVHMPFQHSLLHYIAFSKYLYWSCFEQTSFITFTIQKINACWNKQLFEMSLIILNELIFIVSFWMAHFPWTNFKSIFLTPRILHYLRTCHSWFWLFVDHVDPTKLSFFRFSDFRC